MCWSILVNILIVFKCVQGFMPKFPNKATNYSFPVMLQSQGFKKHFTVNSYTMDRNIKWGTDLWFEIWISLKGIFFKAYYYFKRPPHILHGLLKDEVSSVTNTWWRPLDDAGGMKKKDIWKNCTGRHQRHRTGRYWEGQKIVLWMPPYWWRFLYGQMNCLFQEKISTEKWEIAQ